MKYIDLKLNVIVTAFAGVLYLLLGIFSWRLMVFVFIGSMISVFISVKAREAKEL